MRKIHIGGNSRADEVFDPFILDNMTGYLRRDFNLPEYWRGIRENMESCPPFYALKDWRKVFYIPLPEDNAVYIKIVDERRHEKGSFLTRLFSTEASRYLSTYRLFRKNSISTPDLLFTLGEKKGPFWVKSIMGTRELRDHVALSDYFTHDDPATPRVKALILKETVHVAAKLHALGIYFSMDGRNIFIRKPCLEGQSNIALIDLDHVKRSRLGMPERRRQRNLDRFRATLKNVPGMEESDFWEFLSRYNHCYQEEKGR